MAQAELKTKKTEVSVDDFLNSIPDESQKNDCIKIGKMMEEISGEKPKMWGSAIIGFVDEHLKYDSGRELDWFKIGLSPRKSATTIYGIIGSPKQVKLLEKLGKHTTGKGCLYIQKLSDVDEKVLKEMIEESID